MQQNSAEQQAGMGPKARSTRSHAAPVSGATGATTTATTATTTATTAPHINPGKQKHSIMDKGNPEKRTRGPEGGNPSGVSKVPNDPGFAEHGKSQRSHGRSRGCGGRGSSGQNKANPPKESHPTDDDANTSGLSSPPNESMEAKDSLSALDYARLVSELKLDSIRKSQEHENQVASITAKKNDNDGASESDPTNAIGEDKVIGQVEELAESRRKGKGWAIGAFMISVYL
jgi:hypothetical protein